MIFKSLIFKFGLQIDILKQFYEIDLRWMSQNTTDVILSYLWSDISYIYYFLPLFTVSRTKPVIFLLCNNLFIYQVLCTLIYRKRSLYSFLLTLD